MKVELHSAAGFRQATSCPGCDAPALGGDYCASCQFKVDVFDAYARERESHSLPVREFLRKGKTQTSRLDGITYATAAIAVMLLLLWETRSFWIEWFEMWFGGQ